MQKAAPADAAMGKRRICKQERDFAGVGFARCGRWGRLRLSGKSGVGSRTSQISRAGDPFVRLCWLCCRVKIGELPPVTL